MFNHKDLDALLWDWAADTIKGHDSGFPSNYELKERCDTGTVFVPDYYPKPKIRALGNIIFNLKPEQKNIIGCRYLLCLKIPEIAKKNGCHNATVYRKLNETRKVLIDEMRIFLYAYSRVRK